MNSCSCFLLLHFQIVFFCQVNIFPAIFVSGQFNYHVFYLTLLVLKIKGYQTTFGGKSWFCYYIQLFIGI